MLEKIIDFSIKNKLMVILFTLTIVGFGLFAVFNIPVGSVPDITNNQVQVITTSGNLSTQEIEQFITAPIELEMANLPGVQEIRSISKFGISLVTVVFDDNMGTYLPRQLIAEKIKSAAENIPEAYGMPEMGPISTGLGEIYQYILDIKPGYEDQFTPMDLRTIQDWIVKRRLSGINGVVEVNSWGGHLKQYEIAINPVLLSSLDLNLMDVYQALESNNSITGAAYIEKTNQSYFIRGDGQIKSLDDIEKIVVRQNAGMPILVKDVAKVHFGYANRFGAITANGKGETVLGQIMMLKDANSKVVIKDVNERISEIQKNLPEGIFINPILERGELISKTTKTVVENLILGALIVFITVILLLGNLRSALVIASMIPLALLFTISMMYLFGIDANLMSLGALDFGIIIDGAVIIVEFIVIRMSSMKTEILATKSDDRMVIIDKISIEGASKMMKSAIFGQIIILIVFIPILSLSGVEGKMFQPMALSFSFAIIGAMILGLTWLPVASSLFLRPVKSGKKNISDWIIANVYKLYFPVIVWSCKHKRIVLGLALGSLVLTGFLFSKMGGEFVPTLDEGDFVIQPVLKTGTSLSKTIEITTQIEQILIENFPDEVDQIVSRIGAAEVPTDPMSMEEVDVIIKLHPKHDWQLAKTKEQLAELFEDALSVLPGIDYEFTQPIEMRFNELITGVRSDIAIKIYGEDMEYIDKKAFEIKNKIVNVPGASDVIVEKTSGLPQIKVTYDRDKIAHYGIDISTLNTYLSAAFGGKIAGTVFEGERRFDMVMRFQNQNRIDIQNIEQLLIPINDKYQVPLTEFAQIEYSEGPAKISRDNTRRRVVVSVNVRNRDLQSVVTDIQTIVDNDVHLKSGTFIEYGGQFENLQNATNRLLLAVPVALLLIFIFLHFAFKSFKDAVMIFTAIPLATVGGVVLLWLRGLPFSVSAGVGFIALFGIAVLNGIVLIEHLKELQHKGFTSMHDLIIQGTKDRLRPVMLTAGAAAMGFLPMAISTGAGAEVQRPLATVVIGGLVTSTMLTLVVLPLLFEIFYNVIGIKLFPLKFIRSKISIILIGLLLVPGISTLAQNRELNLEQVVEIAIENNKAIKAYSLKIDQTRVLAKTAFSPGKTIISYGTDQNNIAENGYALNIWGVQQDFNFPTLYVAEKNAKAIEVSIAEAEWSIEKNRVLKDVSNTYFELQYFINKCSLSKELDSIYTVLLKGIERRYQLNDISHLESLQIKAKRNQIALLIKDLEANIDHLYFKLKVLMDSDEAFEISSVLEVLPTLSINVDTVPLFNLLALQSQYTESLIKVEKNKALPDLSFNYFLGTNGYAGSEYYHGFEFGVAVPLFFGEQRAKVKGAKVGHELNTLLFENQKQVVNLQLKTILAENAKYKAQIVNYNEVEKALVDEIKRTTIRFYDLQQIDFYQFVNSFDMAMQIQLAYFKNIFDFNSSTLELMYYSN